MEVGCVDSGEYQTMEFYSLIMIASKAPRI
jgi:hypothetical protein